MPQPEQVEVVDEERAHEHEPEAEGEQAAQQHPSRGVVDGPDGASHGPPQPEQEEQGGARQQDVGRALDRRRHDPGPPLLEPPAGHHAVLDREEGQEGGIDGQRDAERSPGGAVEARRHAEVADEPDGVEESAQEDQVDGAPIGEKQDPLQHRISSSSLCSDSVEVAT